MPRPPVEARIAQLEADRACSGLGCFCVRCQLADIRCANNVLQARVEELEALMLLLRQRAFSAP